MVWNYISETGYELYRCQYFVREEEEGGEAIKEKDYSLEMATAIDKFNLALCSWVSLGGVASRSDRDYQTSNAIHGILSDVCREFEEFYTGLYGEMP